MFRAYKPLTFFGGMGLTCFALSLVPGVLMALEYSREGSFSSGGLAALAAGGFGVGVLLMAIGITLHTLNARILEMSHTLAKRIAKQRERSTPTSTTDISP
jgi:hypothetical protein